MGQREPDEIDLQIRRDQKRWTIGCLAILACPVIFWMMGLVQALDFGTSSHEITYSNQTTRPLRIETSMARGGTDEISLMPGEARSITKQFSNNPIRKLRKTVLVIAWQASDGSIERGQQRFFCNFYASDTLLAYPTITIGPASRQCPVDGPADVFEYLWPRS